MEAISPEVYSRIDNDLYNKQGDICWDENQILHLLKTSINPLRFGYFMRILREELKFDFRYWNILDVGCGGGILAEEFSAAGLNVIGIDPSSESLRTAEKHARENRLDIQYLKGSGEEIPMLDETFRLAYCCDVLEHVKNLPKTISEIARVLKPGGVFFFDTINRTIISKLVAIKIWQEWKSTAFMPPHLHVWEMFIKPRELAQIMENCGFEVKQFRGSSPNVSIPKMITYLRRRAAGKMTFKELGEKFKLVESNDMNLLYMGYAIKK